MRCKSEETMEQIKNAVEEFYFSHYRSPSIGELAAEVGYAKSTVHSYLWEMDRRGLLSYNGKTAETAVTRKANAEVVLTPVLGGISCGQPEYVEEDFEAYVALPTALFGSGEFFCCAPLPAKTAKTGMIIIMITTVCAPGKQCIQKKPTPPLCRMNPGTM